MERRRPHFGVSSLLLLAIGFSAQLAHSDPAVSDEASRQTQALLKDPTARANAIKGDKDAEAADAKASSVAGSEANKQKMYEISADIFNKIAKDNGQNSAKIEQSILSNQDPAAFLKSLTPDQRAAIEKLARDIASQSGK